MAARKRSSDGGSSGGTSGRSGGSSGRRSGTTDTTTSFRKGDRVAWNTSQGETHGVVERKLVARTHVEGHEVAASRSDPQYLVRSEKTGRTAAHKPSALRRRD